MSDPSRVEISSRQASGAKIRSVRKATSSVVAARRARLDEIWGTNLNAARAAAAALKDEVLENHSMHLDRFCDAATRNGMQIHRASDAAEARQIILQIMSEVASSGATVVKGKSMATEEIHLNAALEAADYEVVETDLGEFVVQLDEDLPSHIVAPIIHKSRQEIAQTFAREGIGDYTDNAEQLMLQARGYLREKFQHAEVGVSGVNFAVAETGHIVIVENEGNNRLSTTVPRVHIAVMGVERLVAKQSDLPLFLRLLAASSTGQQITTYTHVITGPRRSDDLDGPEEVHIVLLDNGRSQVLAGPYRSILRCIRCGACLNVCPVYRASSGHAYGHVYSGPLGAVLAPALDGVGEMGDLADASTLCGACEEVCPVAIPIPDMLLRIRKERQQLLGEPSFRTFAQVASQPVAWRIGLKMLPVAVHVPAGMQQGWAESHAPPERAGRDFRSWWRRRQTTKDTSATLTSQEIVVEISHCAAETNRIEPENGLNPPVPLVAESSKAGLASDFERRFSQLGGEVAEFSDLIQLIEKDWIIDDSARPFLRLAAVKEAEDVWLAGVGCTRACALVAETGSILVSAGPQERRMASLAPEVHVVLAQQSDIVASLDDVMPKLGDRTSVLISGPSRTADIEGILIHGVHGPKRVLLVWV